MEMLGIFLCIVISHAIQVEDPNNLAGSFNAYMKLREKLPLALRNQLWITDDAEEAILEDCAKHSATPRSLYDAYIAARTAEREIFKNEAIAAGRLKAMEMMVIYRALRKDKPWNFMKLQHKFKACFEKPSIALSQYEVLKRDEDAVSDMSNSQSAQLVKPQEEEDEEMERGVRAKDVETVEVEKTANTEDGEDVLATVDETEGATEIYESPESITSVDVINTKINTITKASDNGALLRFAMIFGMVMHVVIVILILASQGHKLSEWCRGSKRTEVLPARGETEPLHTGKQIPASGTAFNMSKPGFNPA